MFARKIFVFCIIFLGFGTDVYPQLNQLGKFELDSRRNRKVVVPFKLINNLIVIPLTLNDSDTLNFVLDTGVGTMLITEVPENKEISLNYVRTLEISGLGDGESVEVFYSPQNKIRIGKAVGTNQDILVLVNDVFHLSNLLGTKVNGLIGYSVFKDLIVELDYSRKRLILHEHEKYSKKYFDKKESDSWISQPINLIKQKPYIDVGIIEKDGSKESVNLLLDSGASHSMSLYHTANQEIHLPEKRIRSFLGSGISGEINGYLGRIDTLVIGNRTLINLVVSYPDEEGIKKALIYSNRDGSIGADVLRRFTIFFNYKDSSMIMKPNRNFNESFTYNISGIEFATPYPGVPIFTVTHVRDSSIAHKADVQIGDLLVQINRLGPQDYDISTLNHIFQTEGRRVRFKILRNAEIIRKEILLVNEID